MLDKFKFSLMVSINDNKVVQSEGHSCKLAQKLIAYSEKTPK